MRREQLCTAILLSAMVALDFGVHPVFSQVKSDSAAEYQWSLTFSLGISSRGPESDIENVMVASGFGQSSPDSWFGPGRHHPVSRAGYGLPWAMGLRYAINPPFQLGIIVSNASKGEIVGYRNPFMYLTVNYSVLTFGTAAYIQVSNLRLGFGPALSIVKSWMDDVSKTAHVSNVAKLGVLLDLGLSLPDDSRFFFDVDFQYLYIGKAEIGPYAASFVDSSATMPASRVNFSGWLVSIGVGVRI